MHKSSHGQSLQEGFPPDWNSSQSAVLLELLFTCESREVVFAPRFPIRFYTPKLQLSSDDGARRSMSSSF